MARHPKRPNPRSNKQTNKQVRSQASMFSLTFIRRWKNLEDCNIALESVSLSFTAKSLYLSWTPWPKAVVEQQLSNKPLVNRPSTKRCEKRPKRPKDSSTLPVAAVLMNSDSFTIVCQWKKLLPSWSMKLAIL